MYKLHSFLLLFNKFVSVFITTALLSMVFTFNIDNNVKVEIDTLYKATSISDCYNSIVNFSCNVVDKILSSLNIVKNDVPVKKNSSDKNNNTQKNRVDFVQLNNEKLENSKIGNNDFQFDCFTIQPNSFSFLLLNKIVLCSYFVSKLFLVTTFCYFARGNIEKNNIKFNNIVKGTRLV